MINNYKDFIKLNEEAEFGSNKSSGKLGGMLKNLLGGLMKDVADEFKKPLDDFNKKLGNQKDKDNVIKVVNDYLKTHKATLTTSMEQATTPPALVDTIEDNLRTAYGSIKATVGNFGNESYTFEEIFADSPDRTKKLMNKNEKKFDKNVNQFSTDLVLSFGKPYGITEEMLKETPEEAKARREKKDIKNATKVEATNDNLHSDYNDKLYEAEGDVVQEEKVVSEDDMVKLKGDVVKWFDNTIYRNLDKKLEEIKKEEPKPQGDDINAKIDNIPNDITKNKDSVKAIINKLADSDKQTIIKVRDMLGLDMENTPI